MKPGGQRRKGHNFERYVARRLREVWPEAKRGLTQSRGATTPDVDGTPWWIECKTGKRVNVRKAFEQARRDSHAAMNSSRPVIVIAKVDRGKPFVFFHEGGEDLVSLDEFIETCKTVGSWIFDARESARWG